MTESGEGGAKWVPVLSDLARLSGHELRNALNGLVVNLEVVRARSATLDQASQPFLAQAIDQADESTRLAEGAIALLNVIIAAIGEDGRVNAKYVEPNGVGVETSEAEAERAVRSLAALAARTTLNTDVSGRTVILSIPERTSDSIKKA